MPALPFQSIQVNSVKLTLSFIPKIITWTFLLMEKGCQVKFSSVDQSKWVTLMTLIYIGPVKQNLCA